MTADLYIETGYIGRRLTDPAAAADGDQLTSTMIPIDIFTFCAEIMLLLLYTPRLSGK